MLSVRPFTPRALPPLPRYYGPLRLPTRPPRRFVSLRALVASLPPCRVPRRLGCSFHGRCPHHPGRSDGCTCCCFTTGFVWLHPRRRTGHLRIPIGRIGFTCVYGSRVLPPIRLTPSREPPLVWLHAEQALTWRTPSVHKIKPGLSW